MAIDASRPDESPEGRPPDEDPNQQPASPAGRMLEGESARPDSTAHNEMSRAANWSGPDGWQPRDVQGYSEPEAPTQPGVGARDRQAGDPSADTHPPPGSVQDDISRREQDLPARQPNGRGEVETRPDQDIESDETAHDNVRIWGARAGSDAAPVAKSVQKAITGTDVSESSQHTDVLASGPHEAPDPNIAGVVPAATLGISMVGMAIRRYLDKPDDDK